ncbi:hypothetical protein M1145_00020 [Patescibacteria group bacterium]|nr:hypothetical protein [Patescibacteria group bacterium]
MTTMTPAGVDITLDDFIKELEVERTKKNNLTINSIASINGINIDTSMIETLRNENGQLVLSINGKILRDIVDVYIEYGNNEGNIDSHGQSYYIQYIQIIDS